MSNVANVSNSMDNIIQKLDGTYFWENEIKSLRDIDMENIQNFTMGSFATAGGLLSAGFLIAHTMANPNLLSSYGPTVTPIIGLMALSGAAMIGSIAGSIVGAIASFPIEKFIMGKRDDEYYNNKLKTKFLVDDLKKGWSILKKYLIEKKEEMGEGLYNLIKPEINSIDNTLNGLKNGDALIVEKDASYIVPREEYSQFKKEAELLKEYGHSVSLDSWTEKTFEHGKLTLIKTKDDTIYENSKTCISAEIKMEQENTLLYKL